MDSRITTFFDRLDNLTRGERATMKESVGRTMEEAKSKAITLFYRCLPESVPSYLDDRYFAAGCLYCACNCKRGEVTFPGAICRARENGTLSKSGLHRVETLISLSWDEDGYMSTKLSRLLLMLQKDNPVSLNFPQLLSDLCWWNRDDKAVQYRWAREIYTKENDET